MAAEIEIHELREAGSDGGALLGYYAKGHVAHWNFAQACNHYTGACEGYDIRHVHPDRVKHVWWRTVPISGDPGMSAYHDAEPGSRGAWQATVADVLSARSVRNEARIIAEASQRHSYGFSAGVNWCLRVLDAGHPEARDLLVKAWGNGAADRSIKDALDEYR